QMSGVARTTSLFAGEFGGLRVQLVVHAAGALVLLVVATVLSIYKPWGLTPYGKRKQLEKSGMAPAPIARSGRGFYVVVGIIAVLLTLLILHHLAGGGLRHH